MEALVEGFRRFREEVFAVTYCPGVSNVTKFREPEIVT